MIIKKKIEGRYQEYIEMACADKTLRNADKGMLVTLIGLKEDTRADALSLSSLLAETHPTVGKALINLENAGYLRRKIRVTADGRRYSDGNIELVFPENKRGVVSETQ